MSLPAWPSSVPSSPIAGWAMPTMFVKPIATDMEGGNQRLRSTPGGNVAIMDYPLRALTAAQWSDLDTFFRVTLNNGSSRFTMPIFTGSGLVTKTVQLEQGTPPQVSRGPARVRVAMRLRVFGM